MPSSPKPLTRPTSGRLPAWTRPAAGAAALALLLPVLAGCASSSGVAWYEPYRMDIVQGNVVTREQAALVRPGMTRQQVRDILGSPMLTDLLHADRWDYVFTIDRPGTPPQQRRIVALFQGDKLERIEAPDLPTEREFVAAIARGKSTAPVPALELPPERLKALPVPAKAATEPARTLGAVREYPPLEPQ